MKNSAMRFGAAVLLALGLSGAVSAATLSEADVSGGDFSGWANPTTVAAGPTLITGTWGAQNDFDSLRFTGLTPGAQTITITFAPLVPIGPTDWSFSAGGLIKWATDPFAHEDDGQSLTWGFSLQHWNRDTVPSFTLTLADSFAGELYFNLKNTHGAGLLTWSIDAPGNAAVVTPPASVPLPASGLLLPLALGGLAFWRRRRV
jgi:hypothetical protein